LKASAAIDSSVKILRTRLEKAGFGKDDIAIAPHKNNIELTVNNLPANQELSSLRNLCVIPGRLEFWETYENSEIYSLLDSVDEILGTLGKNNRDKNLPQNLQTRDDSLTKAKSEHPLFAISRPAIYQNERGQYQLSREPLLVVLLSRILPSSELILTLGMLLSSFPRV
jgi:SecD/SecF fusion protein